MHDRVTDTTQQDVVWSMGESDTGSPSGDAVSRVVLTYDETAVPEAVRFWVHDEVTGDAFGASFSQRHDSVREGERFEEFVSRGCGVPVDVTLRAATVEGGHRLDGTAEIVVQRAD